MGLREVGLTACLVDRERAGAKRGDQKGQRPVSVPTAPATTHQTLHHAHKSKGVKFFIKAHEQGVSWP